MPVLMKASPVPAIFSLSRMRVSVVTRSIWACRIFMREDYHEFQPKQNSNRVYGAQHKPAAPGAKLSLGIIRRGSGTVCLGRGYQRAGSRGRSPHQNTKLDQYFRRDLRALDRKSREAA